MISDLQICIYATTNVNCSLEICDHNCQLQFVDFRPQLLIAVCGFATTNAYCSLWIWDNKCQFADLRPQMSICRFTTTNVKQFVGVVGMGCDCGGDF